MFSEQNLIHTVLVLMNNDEEIYYKFVTRNMKEFTVRNNKIYKSDKPEDFQLVLKVNDKYISLNETNILEILINESTLNYADTLDFAKNGFEFKFVNDKEICFDETEYKFDNYFIIILSLFTINKNVYDMINEKIIKNKETLSSQQAIKEFQNAPLEIILDGHKYISGTNFYVIIAAIRFSKLLLIDDFTYRSNVMLQEIDAIKKSIAFLSSMTFEFGASSLEVYSVLHKLLQERKNDRDELEKKIKELQNNSFATFI